MLPIFLTVGLDIYPLYFESRMRFFFEFSLIIYLVFVDIIGVKINFDLEILKADDINFRFLGRTDIIDKPISRTVKKAYILTPHRNAIQSIKMLNKAHKLTTLTIMILAG